MVDVLLSFLSTFMNMLCAVLFIRIHGMLSASWIGLHDQL